MKCNECKELLVDYLYEEVDPATHASIEAALERCPECRAELAELRQTMSAFDTVEELEVPAKLHNDIVRHARLAAAEAHAKRSPIAAFFAGPAFGVAFSAVLLGGGVWIFGALTQDYGASSAPAEESAMATSVANDNADRNEDDESIVARAEIIEEEEANEGMATPVPAQAPEPAAAAEPEPAAVAPSMDAPTELGQAARGRGASGDRIRDSLGSTANMASTRPEPSRREDNAVANEPAEDPAPGSPSAPRFELDGAIARGDEAPEEAEREDFLGTGGDAIRGGGGTGTSAGFGTGSVGGLGGGAGGYGGGAESRSGRIAEAPADDSESDRADTYVAEVRSQAEASEREARRSDDRSRRSSAGASPAPAPAPSGPMPEAEPVPQQQAYAAREEAEAQGAVALLEADNDLADDESGTYETGMDAFDAGRMAAAAAAFEQYAADAPRGDARRPSALMHAAVAHIRAGREDAARRLLRQLIEQHPDAAERADAEVLLQDIERPEQLAPTRQRSEPAMDSVE